jgi:hypothetical protein
MPDEEFNRLSDSEQRNYNRKIEAKDEYNRAREAYDTSMSLIGPGILTVIGILSIPLFFIGLLLIIPAVIWAFLRVSSRAQAYARFRDAETDLKEAIAAEKER